MKSSIITSLCWTGAGTKSFFGLRPGFGFAGMTHSFEASSEMIGQKKGIKDNKYQLPTG
jgi:hypothetical protein